MPATYIHEPTLAASGEATEAPGSTEQSSKRHSDLDFRRFSWDINDDNQMPLKDEIRTMSKRANTIKKTLMRNLTPAPVRKHVMRRSAGPQQLFEDRQPTPPLPPTLKVPVPAPTDNLLDFHNRHKQLEAQLFDVGKTDLFYTLTRSDDSTQPKTAVLNISALQNLAVYQLQLEISCYVEYMYRNSKCCKELDGFTPLVDLMKKYSDAVRDLDYMRQCALRGFDEDPFVMKSSRALERSIFETTQLIPNHVLPKGPLPLPKDYNNVQLRAIGRNEANRATHHQKQLSRFAMSALGGLLLLAPVLIMANTSGKVSSLVTTCVALVVFSALVTLFTELGPHEILATTAAYAAVLVVFVGTSSSNQSVAAVAATG